MNFIKRSAYFFVEHILCLVLSLVVVTIFSKALNPGTARIVYSVIMAAIFMTSIYANSWKSGAKDYRSYKVHARHDPEIKKFNNFRGFFYGIPYAVFCVGFALAGKYGNYIVTAIYKLSNICFAGFVLNSSNDVSLMGAALVGIVTIAFSGVGYIVSKTGFSISDTILPRLVYKQKKK